jgi:peptide/nickel transport system permease protein
MIPAVARRLASLVLTLLAAAVVVFWALSVLPGDPASFMLGTQADPASLAALRAELGLDRPLAERFGAWLAGMATGDMGTSHIYRVPVGDLVGERLAVSLPLAAMALAMAVAVGLPLGAAAALQHGRAGDTAISVLAQAGLAVPNFWFGLLLVLVFSSWLGWFAAGGFPGWSEGYVAGLGALVLPAIALALPQAAILVRVTRAALLEVLSQDFMRTARAKGLDARRALVRHALPNALVPVLALMGLQFSFLLAGGIIIESVFAIPGLGQLVFQAVLQRDLPVVQAVVMLLVAAVVVVAMLVELLQVAVDPRLRRPDGPLRAEAGR